MGFLLLGTCVTGHKTIYNPYKNLYVRYFMYMYQ